MSLEHLAVPGGRKCMPVRTHGDGGVAEGQRDRLKECPTAKPGTV